ncbi:ABC transporter permease, partial [Candidatus Sumerlaeota bacterium]|nr:ABC transporter permease [Candidatus Sumerlaeota bacterium]
MKNNKDTQVYTASQWQLMWWKFRRHKLAVLASAVVIALYLVAFLCEFLAPCALERREIAFSYAPPQRIHFFAEDGFHFRPFVYGLKGVRHPATLRIYYREDKSKIYPIKIFVKGQPYKLWGVFRSQRHLLGVGDGGTMFLLGADSLGRDLLSRIIYGSRISLT